MGPFANQIKKTLQKEGKILQKTFFETEEVVPLAQKILGMFLFTRFEGVLTGGIITETEAYCGAHDKACHAYGNRRTKRTEVMFKKGGYAYIYLCYGLHHLFNVVVSKENHPAAILIRALFPTHGIETMLKRRKASRLKKTLASGPGSLSQALGLHTRFSGLPLTGPEIWIEDRQLSFTPHEILSSPRIGVDYAEEDALLPYRFFLPNNVFFS